MDERERRAQISRRLKAARWLAGGTKANGKPEPLSAAELVAHDALVDQAFTANRVQEIEQCKAGVRGSDLDALTTALQLPGWFAGLYPAEASRDEVEPSDAIGAALLRLAADVREHRQGQAGPRGTSREEGRPGGGAEGRAG